MSLANHARAVTVMRVVADIERSTTFYVNQLGASLHSTHGGTSAVFDLFGTWLLLVTGGGPDEGKPTVTLAEPADSDRPSAQLIFRVDDCRAAYAELSDKGVPFLAPPHDRGGEIRAFFRDPDGHLFEMSQVVTS
ncbi:MAG: VOC family protein [Myxococcota bacterium]